MKCADWLASALLKEKKASRHTLGRLTSIPLHYYQFDFSVLKCIAFSSMPSSF